MPRRQPQRPPEIRVMLTDSRFTSSRTFRGDEILDTTLLDLYGTPTELANTIQQFDATHTECSLDFSCEAYYDGNSHSFNITGWRPATDEEKQGRDQFLREQTETEEAKRLRELQRARRLLRDAGEL